MSTDTSTDAGARPPPNNQQPPEILERIPPLYATQYCSDPVVQAKLFTPWTTWTWFVTECDGQNTCFGLVSGHEVELGYFNLAELEEIEEIEGPGGLRVERDLHFEPQPLSKVCQDLERPRDAQDGFTARDSSDDRITTASGSIAVDHVQGIPFPFDRPGIRLVETWLDTAGHARSGSTGGSDPSGRSALRRFLQLLNMLVSYGSRRVWRRSTSGLRYNCDAVSAFVRGTAVAVMPVACARAVLV